MHVFSKFLFFNVEFFYFPEIVSGTENIEISEIMHMLDDDESVRPLGAVFFK